MFVTSLQFNWFFLFISAFFCLTTFLLFLSFNHFILVLLFLDLLLLVNIMLLVFYTQLTGEVLGYSYALLLLGVAAADTAVGLGLFIVFFKTTKKTSII